MNLYKCENPKTKYITEIKCSYYNQPFSVSGFSEGDFVEASQVTGGRVGLSGDVDLVFNASSKVKGRVNKDNETVTFNTNSGHGSVFGYCKYVEVK